MDIGRRLGFDFRPFEKASVGVADGEGGGVRARFARGGREQDCEKQSRRKKVKQWSYLLYVLTLFDMFGAAALALVLQGTRARVFYS